MKKTMIHLFCFMAFCLFLPTIVMAEDSCNEIKARVKAITVENSEGEVAEIKGATIEEDKLNLDLAFYHLYSRIRYKVTVENPSNESYYIDPQDILKNYFHYKVELIDNNNHIKPNGDTSFYLVAAYDKQVPEEELVGKDYQDENTVEFLITDIPINGIVNPSTKRSKLIMVIILAIVAAGLVYQKKLERKEKLSLFLLGAFLLPITIHGMCKYNIELKTNVTISNEDVNVCTYEGELVKGAEYVNGDYTYRYKQRKTDTGWEDMEEDAWGVTLTVANTFAPITSPKCTIINQKRVIQESAIKRYSAENLDYITTATNFKNGFGPGVNTNSFEKITILNNKTIPSSAIKSWDVSNKGNSSIQAWYTDEDNDRKYELYIGSNGGVLANPNMSQFFSGFENVEEIKGLENLDVSGVSNMSAMMSNLATTTTKFDIDLSTWDTRNVTDMSYLFANSGLHAELYRIKGLDKWNTARVTNMAGMFAGAGRYSKEFSIGKIKYWNTQSVSNMSNMFNFAGEKASKWETIEDLNVFYTNIDGIFANCPNAKLNLNLHRRVSGYANALDNAATKDNTEIVVNYSSEVNNIDSIIATKSGNSNITKGQIIQ